MAVGGLRFDFFFVVLVDGAHFPDLGRVVGGACGELAHVGGEQDASDVGGVCGEVSDWNQLRGLVVLDELPDENVSLDSRKETRSAKLLALLIF